MMVFAFSCYDVCVCCCNGTLNFSVNASSISYAVIRPLLILFWPFLIIVHRAAAVILAFFETACVMDYLNLLKNRSCKSSHSFAQRNPF